jgi:hypothetical protein
MIPSLAARPVAMRAPQRQRVIVPCTGECEAGYVVRGELEFLSLDSSGSENVWPECLP